MKRLFRQTGLSNQLLAGFSLSFLLMGLVTLGVNYSIVKTNLNAEEQEHIEATARSLEFVTQELLPQSDISAIQRIAEQYITPSEVAEVLIVAPNGKPLVSATIDQDPSLITSYPEFQTALNQVLQAGNETQLYINRHRQSRLIHLLPFQNSYFNKNTYGVIVVAIETEHVHTITWRIFTTSSVTLLVGTLGMLGLMWWLVRRNVLVPLNYLQQAVIDSKKSNQFSLSSTLPNNEIRFLATTFSSIFAQQQQAEQALQETVTHLKQQTQQLEAMLHQLQQTQLQLVQSEKMSSLGQLVAGLAHEINNPINFIYGNVTYANSYIREVLHILELYQKHYPLPQAEIQQAIESVDLDFLAVDLPRLLSSMKVGSERIREIVKSLRSFSRLDEAELKPANVHEGLDSTLMILQHRLKARVDRPDIQVIKDYGEVPFIDCYPGQLNQVFMHVLSNSIDALDEKTQANLGARQDHSYEIRIQTRMLNAERIEISITDTGMGMNEKTCAKLFDPFFTTKPIGKGTGLGLSISYQIVVERHQGSLCCQSVPGRGTKFTIGLPIYHETQEIERSNVILFPKVFQPVIPYLRQTIHEP
jgi:signal transduction histidine kinase